MVKNINKNTNPFKPQTDVQNALSEKNREILSPTRISKLKNMTDMKVKVSDLQPHFPKLTSPSMKMKKKNCYSSRSLPL